MALLCLSKLLDNQKLILKDWEKSAASSLAHTELKLSQVTRNGKLD